MNSIFSKTLRCFSILIFCLSIGGSVFSFADQGIEMILDSKDGSTSLSVKDSDSTEVFSIDSKGRMGIFSDNINVVAGIDVLTLRGSVRSLTSGTFRGLYLNYKTATPTNLSQFVPIDIGSITDRANLAITGIRIGSVIGASGGNNVAIAIGSGWDKVLTVNGIDIISGSGTLSFSGEGSFYDVRIGSKSRQTIDSVSGNLILDTMPGYAVQIDATLDINGNIIDMATHATSIRLKGSVNALNIDGATLSVDSTNNRIGINTTIPSTDLEVIGIVKATSFKGNGSELTGVLANNVAYDAIESPTEDSSVDFVTFTNTWRTSLSTQDFFTVEGISMVSGDIVKINAKSGNMSGSGRALVVRDEGVEVFGVDASGSLISAKGTFGRVRINDTAGQIDSKVGDLTLEVSGGAKVVVGATLKVLGTLTATSFTGDGAGLTGVLASSIAYDAIQSPSGDNVVDFTTFTSTWKTSLSTQDFFTVEGTAMVSGDIVKINAKSGNMSGSGRALVVRDEGVEVFGVDASGSLISAKGTFGRVRINDTAGQIDSKVGDLTLEVSGGAKVVVGATLKVLGVVTATSFTGDGTGLTGVFANGVKYTDINDPLVDVSLDFGTVTNTWKTSLSTQDFFTVEGTAMVSGDIVKINAKSGNMSGSGRALVVRDEGVEVFGVDASGSLISAKGTFGRVRINDTAGQIDSKVGDLTLEVSGGAKVVVGATLKVLGKVTATSFIGNGSELTGVLANNVAYDAIESPTEDSSVDFVTFTNTWRTSLSTQDFFTVEGTAMVSGDIVKINAKSGNMSGSGRALVVRDEGVEVFGVDASGSLISAKGTFGRVRINDTAGQIDSKVGDLTLEVSGGAKVVVGATLKVLGVVTATSFTGDGTGLTGVFANGVKYTDINDPLVDVSLDFGTVTNTWKTSLSTQDFFTVEGTAMVSGDIVKINAKSGNMSGSGRALVVRDEGVEVFGVDASGSLISAKGTFGRVRINDTAGQIDSKVGDLTLEVSGGAKIVVGATLKVLGVVTATSFTGDGTGLTGVLANSIAYDAIQSPSGDNVVDFTTFTSTWKTSLSTQDFFTVEGTAMVSGDIVKINAKSGNMSGSGRALVVRDEGVEVFGVDASGSLISAKGTFGRVRINDTAGQIDSKVGDLTLEVSGGAKVVVGATLKVLGVVTATSFTGDGTGLTGVFANGVKYTDINDPLVDVSLDFGTVTNTWKTSLSTQDFFTVEGTAMVSGDIVKINAKSGNMSGVGRALVVRDEGVEVFGVDASGSLISAKGTFGRVRINDTAGQIDSKVGDLTLEVSGGAKVVVGATLKVLGIVAATSFTGDGTGLTGVLANSIAYDAIQSPSGDNVVDFTTFTNTWVSTATTQDFFVIDATQTTTGTPLTIRVDTDVHTGDVLSILGTTTLAEVFSIDGNGNTKVNTIYFLDEHNNGISTGSHTVNWKASNKQKIILGSNVTIMFISPKGPSNILLKVIQDATGNRIITWPGSVKWPGGTRPTLTSNANAVDFISFYFDGTNYYGSAIFNMQ